MTPDQLVIKIVSCLHGLNLDEEATYTERQIFYLLEQEKMMVLDEDRNMVEVERRHERV